MDTAVTEPTNSSPQLWNPNAAACWSLLFTPVFGALLHAFNWRQLGQTAKAQQSMFWVYGALVVLLVALVLPQSVLRDVRHLPLMALLLAWYFLSAKPQVAYIRDNAISYEKRTWVLPLAIGFVGLVLYSVVASAFVSSPERPIVELLEAESVELVTGMVQERLGPSTSCEGVSLEKEQVSEGTYHGVARLNDGTELPIAVEFDGRQMSVSLRSSGESSR